MMSTCSMPPVAAELRDRSLTRASTGVALTRDRPTGGGVAPGTHRRSIGALDAGWGAPSTAKIASAAIHALVPTSQRDPRREAVSACPLISPPRLVNRVLLPEPILHQVTSSRPTHHRLPPPAHRV